MNWEKCNSCNHKCVCSIDAYHASKGTTTIVKYKGKPIMSIRKIGVLEMDDCPYYEMSAMHSFAEELRAFKRGTPD